MRLRPALPGAGGVRRGQGETHVNHRCQLLPEAPHVSAASPAARALPVVKDGEAVPQEVGPASRRSWGGLRGPRRHSKTRQPSSAGSYRTTQGEVSEDELCMSPAPAFPPGVLERWI